MATYFMFGKYSSEGMKTISPERTQKVVEVLKKYRGEIKGMYALLGDHDLVFIVDFPDVKHVMKASVSLSRLTGIAVSTAHAMNVEEFDKMIVDLY